MIPSPDLKAFPAPSKPQPGVNYVWCAPSLLGEYENNGYRLTDQHSDNNGVRYRLLTKGRPVRGVDIGNVLPRIVCAIPDEEEDNADARTDEAQAEPEIPHGGGSAEEAKESRDERPGQEHERSSDVVITPGSDDASFPPSDEQGERVLDLP